MRRAILLLLLTLLPHSAQGGEIFGLLGGVQQTDADHRSYSFQGEYREGLGENIALSTAYINEGHVPRHHRDGFVPVMIWRRANLLNRQLSVAAGVGPYFYADTTDVPSGKVKNQHGLGGIGGLSATWYFESRLLLQARLNLVQTFDSINTASLLMGIGYQLDPPATPGPLLRPPGSRQKTTDQELTLLLGQTVVNNPDAQEAMALDLEYRYGVFSNLDLSVAWLYEGDHRVARRNGVMTQLWLVREFLGDHLSLGIGVGPYVSLNTRKITYTDKEFDALTTPMLSLTASVRHFDFSPNLTARVSLNRLITHYDRDTDTFLLGIGYLF